jgi:hypothetical protein
LPKLPSLPLTFPLIKGKHKIPAVYIVVNKPEEKQKPVATYAPPAEQAPVTYEAPQLPSVYEAPVNTYIAPSTVFEPPRSSYVPPQSAYEVPTNIYESPKPVQTYEPPKHSYGAPQVPTFYEVPSNTYEAAKPVYVAPSNTYQAAKPVYVAPSNTYQAAKPVYVAPQTQLIYEIPQVQTAYEVPKEIVSTYAASKPVQSAYEHPPFELPTSYANPRPVYGAPPQTYDAPEGLIPPSKSYINESVDNHNSIHEISVNIQRADSRSDEGFKPAVMPSPRSQTTEASPITTTTLQTSSDSWSTTTEKQ